MQGLYSSPSLESWRKFVTIIISDQRFANKLRWKYQSMHHSENCISFSFHIEWDMIVVTVFFSTLNQMDFHLVQNWKENCHHDHIPFNVKGNWNIVFSVQSGFRASFLNIFFSFLNGRSGICSRIFVDCFPVRKLRKVCVKFVNFSTSSSS